MGKAAAIARCKDYARFRAIRATDNENYLEMEREFYAPGGRLWSQANVMPVFGQVRSPKPGVAQAGKTGA